MLLALTGCSEEIANLMNSSAELRDFRLETTFKQQTLILEKELGRTNTSTADLAKELPEAYWYYLIYGKVVPYLELKEILGESIVVKPTLAEEIVRRAALNKLDLSFYTSNQSVVILDIMSEDILLEVKEKGGLIVRFEQGYRDYVMEIIQQERYEFGQYRGKSHGYKLVLDRIAKETAQSTSNKAKRKMNWRYDAKYSRGTSLVALSILRQLKV